MPSVASTIVSSMVITNGGRDRLPRYLEGIVSPSIGPFVPVGIAYFKMGNNADVGVSPAYTDIRAVSFPDPNSHIFDSRTDFLSGSMVVTVDTTTDPRKAIVTAQVHLDGSEAVLPGGLPVGRDKWIEFGIFDHQDVMIGYAQFPPGVAKGIGQAMDFPVKFRL